jgi:hypothetical protein
MGFSFAVLLLVLSLCPLPVIFLGLFSFWFSGVFVFLVGTWELGTLRGLEWDIWLMCFLISGFYRLVLFFLVLSWFFIVCDYGVVFCM